MEKDSIKKEIKIDGHKLRLLNEIKNYSDNSVVQLWSSNFESNDGDKVKFEIKYSLNNKKLEYIAFNPFSGIPSWAIYIEDVNLMSAAKKMEIETDFYSDDFSLALAIGIKICKKILNQ